MTSSDSTGPGHDGQEPSGRDADDPEASRDPVTGSGDHTTGEAQAAENERTDPVA